MNNAYSMDCNSRYVFLSFDSIKTKTKTKTIYFLSITIYLGGEWWFLRNLIGSAISEYPALFTSEENKMASHFASFNDDDDDNFIYSR